MFNQLFTCRQDGDYKDFIKFDENVISQLFPKVKNLIDLMENLIAREAI
jgi:hypothetical protein